MNFFCEKHGKNSRDAHFSMVSKYVKMASLIKRLDSSQDICDAIVNGQSQANDNKLFDGRRRKKPNGSQITNIKLIN